jgi:hypothetical protein
MMPTYELLSDEDIFHNLGSSDFAEIDAVCASKLTATTTDTEVNHMTTTISERLKEIREEIERMEPPSSPQSKEVFQVEIAAIYEQYSTLLCKKTPITKVNTLYIRMLT